MRIHLVDMEKARKTVRKTVQKTVQTVQRKGRCAPPGCADLSLHHHLAPTPSFHHHPAPTSRCATSLAPTSRFATSLPPTSHFTTTLPPSCRSAGPSTTTWSPGLRPASTVTSSP